MRFNGDMLRKKIFRDIKRNFGQFFTIFGDHGFFRNKCFF